jgi:regulator of replication initiation timing
MDGVDTLAIIREMEADPGLRAQLRAVLLGDDLLRLPELVAENTRDIRDLKDAVAELREAVAENTRDIRDLKDAVAGLREAVAELREAVAELREEMSDLRRGQEMLRQEVGRLSAVVGGTVEEDASSVVVTVLERRGWRVHGRPEPVEANGEIDVLVKARTDQGAEVSVLVEAKTRLRPADVRRFAADLEQLVAMSGIRGDYMPYVYGLRVYTGVEETASELGLGVLSPDGERVGGLLRSA